MDIFEIYLGLKIRNCGFHEISGVTFYFKRKDV